MIFEQLEQLYSSLHLLYKFANVRGDQKVGKIRPISVVFDWRTKKAVYKLIYFVHKFCIKVTQKKWRLLLFLSGTFV